MMDTRKIIIFILFLVLATGCASASVTVSDSQRYITVTDNTVQNVSSLYTYLEGVYGETNVTSRMEQLSDGEYALKYELNVPNAGDIFYINGTDCHYLRMGGSTGEGGYRQFQGQVQIEDTEIYFYDYANNAEWNLERTALGGINDQTSYLYRPMKNVILHNTGDIFFGYSYDSIARAPDWTAIDDMVFENITSYNQSSNFMVGNIVHSVAGRTPDNVTFRDITIHGANPRWSGGFTYSKANNSTFENIRFYGLPQDGIVQTSGVYGLHVYGDYNNIDGLYLNNNTYSAINLHGEYWDVKNVSIDYSLHNGFEIETDNSLFENITVRESKSNNNILLVGQVSTNTIQFNNTLRDIYSYNATSTGIMISDGSTQVTVENAYLENSYAYVLDTYGNTIINMTVNNSALEKGEASTIIVQSIYPLDGYPDNFQWADNNTYIDCFGIDTGSYKDIVLYDGKDTRLVNTQITNGIRDDATNTTYWYYPNIIVTNGTHAVEDAVITFSQQAVDGYGDSITTAYTDSNGRLYSSGNRSNWAALRMGIACTITATKSGVSDNVTVIPKQSWFTTDVSDLSGSENELVLSGVAGTGDELSSGTTYTDSSYSSSFNDSGDWDWTWTNEPGVDVNGTWDVDSTLTNWLHVYINANEVSYISKSIPETSNLTVTYRTNVYTNAMLVNYNRQYLRLNHSSDSNDYVESYIGRNYGTREHRVKEIRNGATTQLIPSANYTNNLYTWTAGTSAQYITVKNVIDNGVLDSYIKTADASSYTQVVWNAELAESEFDTVQFWFQAAGTTSTDKLDYINIDIHDAILTPVEIVDYSPYELSYKYISQSNISFNATANINSTWVWSQNGTELYNSTGVNSEYNWTIPDDSDYNITATATNGSLSDSITWIVSEGNEITSSSPASPYSISLGDTAYFNVTSSNNGSVFWTVDATQLGSGSTFNYTPSTATNYTVQAVTDSDMREWILVVSGDGINITSYSPLDTTPTAINGSNVSFSANLSSSGFYEWILNDTVVSNGTSASASYNYTTSSIGDKNITIRTNDDQQTWLLTVENVNADIFSYVTPTNIIITTIPTSTIIISLWYKRRKSKN